MVKTVFYSALGFLARVWSERWPEYLLDLFSIYLCFQATWVIVARARQDAREAARADVGEARQSL